MLRAKIGRSKGDFGQSKRKLLHWWGVVLLLLNISIAHSYVNSRVLLRSDEFDNTDSYFPPFTNRYLIVILEHEVLMQTLNPFRKRRREA